MKKVFFITLAILGVASVFAQKNDWQQEVDYKMEIDFDVNTYRFNGTQKLSYTNNSPYTLNKVFYHLYFNAFQPGSAMDIRLQEIKDPDGRMVLNLGTKDKPYKQSRIAILKPEEIGYLKPLKLTQNNKVLQYEVVGTVLEVTLNKPIRPGKKTVLKMAFEGQVPLQIRRSGRNNKEGVALSMAQWYPKMAAFDQEGWQAHPYIGREFYAEWGDFDVKINIDKDYVLGGTGVIQNNNEVGFGYEDSPSKKKKSTEAKKVWHFKAKQVHDFTWAADKDFAHEKIQVKNGPLLHFLYKKNMDKKYLENWKNLKEKAAWLMDYYSTQIGKYPYPQYSIIQGGDGGMEYGMCTLITGQRSFKSLVGVVAHEMAHAWFQFVLATNESKHPWMDEGFTTYISNQAESILFETPAEKAQELSFKSYANLVSYGIEEPLSTWGDHFHYNYAYGVSSYSKGAVFLAQLKEIIGELAFKKTLKKYFDEYKFKHPSPNKFIRVAEEVSQLSLGWYLFYWTQTTHTVDYGVEVVDKTIQIKRLGRMPMPISLEVTYLDGSSTNYNIPLEMLRGAKQTDAKILKDWSWVKPVYEIKEAKEIKSVQLYPNGGVADLNAENNTWTRY